MRLSQRLYYAPVIGLCYYKKSASSHDEAALLGKKYHIGAKIVSSADTCKLLRNFLKKNPQINQF